MQSQLLACLQWLGEFQVLAFLPLGSETGLPIKDVAELADVPEAQLCRVVRLMAMDGFLCEPQPGYMAHTALSASFVQRPVQLDAAMFLAETATPTALQMAQTRRTTTEQPPAVDWTSKRTQRLWASYLGAVGGADDAHILGQIDWASLGQDHDDMGGGGGGDSEGGAPRGRVVVVVDVGSPPAPPRKALLTLCERHPALRFAIQTEALPAALPHSARHPNIHLVHRPPGTPQTIRDAAVFLVRVSTSSSVPVRQRIESELRAHMDVLDANRSALLILTAPVLPEPGTVPKHAEHRARLRDLSLLQLVGDGNLTLHELITLVHSVRDATSGLAVVKKLYAPNSAFVGLGIRLRAREHLQLDM